jgi:excisionase family DNA binding protein
VSAPLLNPFKPIYRINEAADYLCISRRTLYELVRAGELELGKLAGRSVIKREQLDAYLARNYQRSGSMKGAAPRAA